MVLQTWGDGLDACEAVVALEDAFGCVIDREKFGKIREIAGLGCLVLLFIAGWLVGVVVLLGDAASLLIDYFGTGSAKIVMGTVLAAWSVISYPGDKTAF